MKDINQYTCTLAQAKKLKELGIMQDSLFYYQYQFEEDYAPSLIDNVAYFRSKNKEGYAAFTSQELGELIGSMFNEWTQCWINSNDTRMFTYGVNGVESMTGDIDKLWSFRAYRTDEYLEGRGFAWEVQARAEFLIYLLKK
jgi:hypothetical protein